MAVEQLVAELRLDINQFRAELRRATDSAQNTSRQIERNTARMSRGFDNVSRAASQLRGALATLGVGRLVQDIVRAGATTDSLSRSFRGMLGSAEAATRELDFLRNLTNQLGADFVGTAEGTRLFIAASKEARLTTEQMNSVITGAAQAVTVFGGRADSLPRILYALSQSLSQAQLRMQDVSLQLAQVLPGSMAIFAEAAGFTGPRAIQEFTKAMGEGKIAGEAATNAILNFGQLLQERFGPASVEAAQSAQAAFTRFGNTLFQLRTDIANAGILDAVVIAAQIAGREIRRISQALNEFSVTGNLAAKDLDTSIVLVLRTIANSAVIAAGGLVLAGKGLETLISGAISGSKQGAQALEELVNTFEFFKNILVAINQPSPDIPLVKLRIAGKQAQETMQGFASGLRDVQGLLKATGDDSEELAKKIESLAEAEIKLFRDRIKEQEELEQEALDARFEFIKERADAERELQTELERITLSQSDFEIQELERRLNAYRDAGVEEERIAELRSAALVDIRARQYDREQRELERSLRERQREFDRFAGRIESRLADVFEDALQGNIRDAGEFFRDTMYAAIAQIAARALTTQLVIPAVVALTGGSLSGSGISSLLGGTGTGGSLFAGTNTVRVGQLGNLLNTPIFNFGGSGPQQLAFGSPQGSATPGSAFSATGPGASAGTSVTAGGVIGGVGAGLGVGLTASQLFGQIGAGGTLGADLTSGLLGGAVAGTAIAPGFGTAIGAAIGFLVPLIKNLIEDPGATGNKLARAAPFPGSLVTLPATGGFGDSFGEALLNISGIGGFLDLFKKGPASNLATLTSAGTTGFEGGEFETGPFGNVGLADRFTEQTPGDFDREITNLILEIDRATAQILTDRQEQLAAAALQARGTGVEFSFRKFDDEAAELVADRLQTILEGITPEGLGFLTTQVFEGIDLVEENIPQLAQAFEVMARQFQAIGELDESFENIDIPAAIRSGKTIAEVINGLTALGQTIESLDQQITALTEAMQTPAELFEKRLDQITALQGQLVGAGIEEALRIAPQIQQMVGQAFQLAPQEGVFGQDLMRQQQAQESLISVLDDLKQTLANIPSFQGITEPQVFTRPTLAAVHSGETLYPAGTTNNQYSNSYTVNVYGAPGMNVQTLADQVVRRIEDRGRWNQTRIVTRRR